MVYNNVIFENIFLILFSTTWPTVKRGGGIITYVWNDQITKIREDLSTSDADSEVFTIEITSNKSKNILVSTCYRPPEGDLLIFSNHLKQIFIKNNNEQKKIFCIGDINIDCLQYEKNANIKLFFDEMLQYYIFPIINKPTRVTPTSISAIDNILTNSIFDTSKKAGIIKTDISDHFPVFFSLTQDIKSINSCKIKIYKRKINKFAIQQFKDSLSAELWDKVYQECNRGNTNSAYNNFEKIFLKNYNMHFPIKEKLIKEKYLKCPWITKGIKKSSKKKQKLYIKYLKNRSEANLNVYKQYKNLFEKIKKNSKKNLYSNKIKNSNGNIKETWDIIKEIIGTKHCKSNSLPAQIIIDNNEYNDCPNLASKIHCPNNSFETYLTSVNSKLIFKELKIDELENAINSIKINKSPGVDDISSNIVANVSSQIRKPVFEIFKSSIKTGTVPDKLKVAKIIPIFKTGETFQINNYRPISILPIFSKILERIIYNRLYEYLTQNKLLDKKQFGFQSQHSTEHAILDIVNSISDSFNKKKLVLGTFIDLSKAFDTINHDILLKKMEKYGIKNTTLDWFKSYLCNRQQCVISNDNKYSNLLEIKCGVPQGSILGPLLFLIYINDLPQSLKKLDAVMFANDTNLFYSSASIKNLFESVNNDLDNLNTCEKKPCPTWVPYRFRVGFMGFMWGGFSHEGLRMGFNHKKFRLINPMWDICGNYVVFIHMLVFVWDLYGFLLKTGN
ncbi:uncharacterized protein LOC136073905 [Hydra vulgaris]|uniref:uncharacterized protein LOC136073905 n=1 Tax=Hydra vulgaris TaxID=6087 RepID=UPI0032E9FCB7